LACSLAFGYDNTAMEPADAAVRPGYLKERRRFIAMIAGGLLAAPLAAEAQPIPRIGLLGDFPWEPLRQGLRDLGYVEGKNILFEDRRSRGPK
jgi:hypothetical protein